MESISLKLESNFVKEIERLMRRNRYMTKTEFIREAIRDKINDLEKREILRDLDKVVGLSKHKTTDEELHNVREKLSKEYEKRFK